MRYLNNVEDFCNAAGGGHGAVSQSADIQHFIKPGRGNVAKKRLRFHALS
mgnify:CR=1 FL=1